LHEICNFIIKFPFPQLYVHATLDSLYQVVSRKLMPTEYEGETRPSSFSYPMFFNLFYNLKVKPAASLPSRKFGRRRFFRTVTISWRIRKSMALMRRNVLDDRRIRIRCSASMELSVSYSSISEFMLHVVKSNKNTSAMIRKLNGTRRNLIDSRQKQISFCFFALSFEVSSILRSSVKRESQKILKQDGEYSTVE
jgi:hypothetical protein